jgi:RES domain-containing protein
VTELPAALGGKDLLCWRLEEKRHAKAWDSGEGALRFGGRWNTRGNRAVYSSFDPATAILEIAVHIGFRALERVPHILTCFRVEDASLVRILNPSDIPDDTWLNPTSLGPGQQAFGSRLLQSHSFIALPSTVSRHSWNLLFDPERATGKYSLVFQESFTLDPRLPSR